MTKVIEVVISKERELMVVREQIRLLREKERILEAKIARERGTNVEGNK